MDQRTILIIEDEKDMIKLLKYNLEKEGFRVFSATDGEQGLRLFRELHPDVVLLDLMLPKMSGFEVCKIIRKESSLPILMITAKGEEVDKIVGFELGADDYITKPFSLREVVARIKAALRRFSNRDVSPEAIKIGNLVFDGGAREVRVNGKTAPLTPKEFDLLNELIKEKGRAVSREDLMKRVWGVEESLEIETRTVDQHVARMRKKLGSEKVRIVTVPNFGYRFKMD